MDVHVLLDLRTVADHFPGIGRYAYYLAQALARRPDVRVHLIVHPRGVNTRFPLAALSDLPRWPVPCDPLSPWAQVAALRWTRAWRRAGLQVYHSPYYVFPYAMPLPVVVTCHDTIPTRFPDAFSPGRRWLIRALKRVAFRRARHIVADSRATATDLTRFYGVAPERITVAPLAPAPSFQPQPDTRLAAFRARYGLPERYAVYVGSAKPHKNVPFLLRVWARFSAGHPRPPVLVLAGPGHERWPPQPGVRVLGVVPEEDLPLLYAAAWVCLFPSRYEGFGLPPLEAMACGTPVLCSDIPALAETVADGGLRLPLDQEEPWVEALARVWDDPAERARWAERGRRRAQRFTWERTAAQVVTAYRRALDAT